MTGTVAEYVSTGSGSQTLLFLHGLGGDHTNWVPQIEAFSPQYRCISWTMPGYGDSPALPGLTWPDLADAAAGVLTDAGVERATVVGLSMGGYVAQQLAADHDDRVEHLVLAATTAQFGRGDAEFSERFLAGRLKPLDAGHTPASLAPMVGPSLLSPDASAETVGIVTASMSRISSTAYRQALGCLVTWNFTDSLCEITQPTLCLAGADDLTAPVAAVRALADALPNGEFEVIDNCQHLMNLDRPTEFSDAVRAFLQRQSLRPAG